MLSSSRTCLAIFTAALLLAQPIHAFQSPLSDEAVRDAYFLGQRNDESTRAFFAPYLRAFERPKNGPFVSEVEIYTPFSQLVELSSHRNNYSAQQASEDYHRGGTDRVFVRVRIQFTATYGPPPYLAAYAPFTDRPADAPQRANFSRDFRIGLSQNDQWVVPVDDHHELTNTLPTGHFPFDPDGMGSWIYASDSIANGWLVWLQFDAKDLADDMAQVEILGPNELHLVATFDLAHLR